MWNPPIDKTLGEWVDKAMASVEEGSLEHAKMLVADASQNDRPESAHRAIAAAERLGDDDLRSAALFTLGDSTFWGGRSGRHEPGGEGEPGAGAAHR